MKKSLFTYGSAVFLIFSTAVAGILPIDGIFDHVRDAKAQKWETLPGAENAPLGHTELYKLQDPADKGNAIMLRSDKEHPTCFATSEYYPTDNLKTGLVSAKIFSQSEGKAAIALLLYDADKKPVGNGMWHEVNTSELTKNHLISHEFSLPDNVAYVRVALKAGANVKAFFEMVTAELK